VSEGVCMIYNHINTHTHLHIYTHNTIHTPRTHTQDLELQALEDAAIVRAEQSRHESLNKPHPLLTFLHPVQGASSKHLG
jgi:hypothetical protein